VLTRALADPPGGDMPMLRAQSHGGAISLQGPAKGWFKSCSFTNNRSPHMGGALFMWDHAVAEFESCTFSGNMESTVRAHTRTIPRVPARRSPFPTRPTCAPVGRYRTETDACAALA